MSNIKLNFLLPSTIKEIVTELQLPLVTFGLADIIG